MACLIIGAAPAAAAPSIWFAADDPVVRALKGRPQNDYMALFAKDARWAEGVGVIEISMQFVQRGSDKDLSAVIRFASAHGISLVMAGLMLVGNGTCGVRVEGYAGPRSVETDAGRIKRLGGVIAYIAMDEPLYFGAVYDGPNACRTRIVDLAASVAGRVRHLAAIFPHIQVGDDEPIGAPARLRLPAQLATWLRAYRAAVGTPLAFLHADVEWRQSNWADDLRAAWQLALRSGVRFGVIYDGNPDDPDGAAWSRHALDRVRDVERGLGITPDDAVIQSWMLHPDAMLPAIDSGTLTSLVARYARAHQ